MMYKVMFKANCEAVESFMCSPRSCVQKINICLFDIRSTLTCYPRYQQTYVSPFSPLKRCTSRCPCTRLRLSLPPFPYKMLFVAKTSPSFGNFHPKLTFTRKQMWMDGTPTLSSYNNLFSWINSEQLLSGCDWQGEERTSAKCARIPPGTINGEVERAGKGCCHAQD